MSESDSTDSKARAYRPAAVAGMFYPGSPDELQATVDRLLAEARAKDEIARMTPRGGAPKEAPKALIVPHAGYVYSGPIAATAFAAWADVAYRIRRVVLVGPAHRVYVAGALVAPGAPAFRTPLGEVSVDVEAIRNVPGAIESPRAHAREHSLEVQLPFLQRLLPRAQIIPLLVSDAPAEVVGRALESLWDDDGTVIAISSDLSHYLEYNRARRIDGDTAARVLALDTTIEPERACGCAAINGLLWVARRKGLRAQLLDLRSSGDTAGGRDQVVGYGAFAFYPADRGLE